MDELRINLRAMKERDSNLELYRILVMLLIIAHHYVVNSGITDVMYAYPLCPKERCFYFCLVRGENPESIVSC